MKIVICPINYYSDAVGLHLECPTGDDFDDAYIRAIDDKFDTIYCHFFYVVPDYTSFVIDTTFLQVTMNTNLIFEIRRA